MYSLKRLVDYYRYSEYIWVETTLIKETRKAILIMFDGRKNWFPKAWIARIKGRKNSRISIKISLYHWAKKFQ